MSICKNCGKGFEDGDGSENNEDFCSDDCNYEYNTEQISDQ